MAGCMSAELINEQDAFLKECVLEFSNRFTESDVEYKEAYNLGIPPPPIMCPWYGRPKLTPHKHKGYGNSSSDYGRDHRRNYNYRENNDYRRPDGRFRPY